MGPEGSLQYSLLPANCPYPEPARSISCPYPTSWIYILILSSLLPVGLWSGLFPSDPPPLLSTIRATSPAHLILKLKLVKLNTLLKGCAISNIWFHKLKFMYSRLSVHTQSHKGLMKGNYVLLHRKTSAPFGFQLLSSFPSVYPSHLQELLQT